MYFEKKKKVNALLAVKLKYEKYMIALGVSLTYTNEIWLE